VLRVPIEALLGRSHAPSTGARPGWRLRPPRAILIAGLVILTAVAGYVVYGRLTSSSSAVAAVQTARVTRGTITSSVSGTGTVSPLSQAKLSFGSAGTVTEVDVRVGDSVKQGQTLAKVDATSLALEVSQAQANLSAAQAKLASINAGSTPQDVQAAQIALDAAKAKLAAMQAGGRPEEISQAQASLDSARAQLASVSAGPTQADITAAEQGVASAQAALQTAQNALKTLKDGPTADQIKSAQLDVDKAKNSLWSAQTSRDGTCGGRNPQYQCDAANASVAAAQTAVDSAQQALAALKEPATPEAIAAAERNVASAQAQLVAAQAKLADVKAGPKASDIASAQAAVRQAEQALILKQKPYTDADIQAQRQAVAQAEATLVAKQQPYTDADKLSAQASVEQAKAALELAQYNLSHATLTAPFDGVVSAVNINVGETAASPAIAIVDPNALRLDVTVDETDIAHVQTGQKATITFDSIPGKTFSGTVTGVAPSATVTSGVATYAVTIGIADPGSVKSGMTGNASIIYGEQKNVLTVPIRAVRTQGQNKVVMVLVDGKEVARQVKVGVSNDTRTEIIEGLAEGDQVVIPTTSATSGRVGGAVIGVPQGGPPPGR